MLSKNKIKLIKSLDQKKYRTEHNLFVVEGEKLCNELIHSQFVVGEKPFEIAELFYTLSWKQKHLEDLEELNVTSTEVTESELQKVSQLKTSNQVLALVKIPQKKIPRYDDDLVLVLDGVRDPGNMGTIMRTADWFGIKELICSADCVDAFNSKVVQATMGSLFRINVLYYDLEVAISKIRKHHPLKPVYGATLDGENVYNMSLPQDAILVVGNEAHGISPKSKELLTKEILIPRFGSGESLNVGIATAILCSEFKRQ
ncbi:MAG: RNA methyltransferase [Crocinitomicaceae bacterium]|nr:RNA methyltransferase [Crocinitomicaceae bacterium]|tara:strand:- start:10173 stop:10946 length:774 start_codon:yes stop_codon:yes gene_type:complete